MDMQRKERLTAKRTDAVIDAALFGLQMWEQQYAQMVVEDIGKTFIDPETVRERKELALKIEFLRKTLRALNSRSLAIRAD